MKSCINGHFRHGFIGGTDTKGKDLFLRAMVWKGIYHQYIYIYSHGKSPGFIGKSTISMAIFNGYVKLPEGIYIYMCQCMAFYASIFHFSLRTSPRLATCAYRGQGNLNCLAGKSEQMELLVGKIIYIMSCCHV